MKNFILFLAILVVVLFACTPYAGADMLTNNGQELRVIINDASKLTPEQLLMLKDMAKDQLVSGEKLTEMGVNASVQIRKAEEDRKLASRVVWAAFFFVGMIVIAALTPHFLRKK